jgi:catechol 2,3-dioxygenase-like lactoylglutathione lyase family enzyme
MPRLYDHIDLRVRTLAEVRDFYEVLLPALGFMRETRIPNWLQYAQNVEGPGWEDETYYAVFFEDPCGNRLEICHRTSMA